MRSPSLLDSIRVVMINTSHPGNIGAAARAMRVMGLYNLCLVNPRKHPSKEAVALASGALDVLENAVVTETFEEAVQDCQYIFGTSARSRHIGKPELDVESGICKIKSLLTENPTLKIALVFGTERTGLTNEEVDLCHELLYIPTENNYNSLNIASAIQIIAYELRRQFEGAKMEGFEHKNRPEAAITPAPTASLEGFYQHLEETLIAIDFLDPQYPKHLMRKLRTLYKKAEPTVEEVNILRGILTATLKRADKQPKVQ